MEILKDFANYPSKVIKFLPESREVEAICKIKCKNSHFVCPFLMLADGILSLPPQASLWDW